MRDIISINKKHNANYQREVDATDKREQLIKLREDTGLNRREFSDYFRIPLRTLQDWESGNRQMPDYLLRLMVYNIANELKEDPGVFRKWKEEDKRRRREIRLLEKGIPIEEKTQIPDPASQAERLSRYAELLDQLGSDRIKNKKPKRED